MAESEEQPVSTWCVCVCVSQLVSLFGFLLLGFLLLVSPAQPAKRGLKNHQSSAWPALDFWSGMLSGSYAQALLGGAGLAWLPTFNDSINMNGLCGRWFGGQNFVFENTRD